MTSDLETLAERLERAGHADDAFEGERLRRLVRARLLDETAPEPRIDRYAVVGRLGEGGMGIVYQARDVELDRDVAIKLVRRRGAPDRADVEQQRLLSEARALAQLSHPNVVAIYDVGLHRDMVFIAMELVPGVTLRAYAVAGNRDWREIVRVYKQAGEGLAAVHDAGLVHRDFKPDNVLVGDDGRVRVADFGLARPDESMETGSTSADDDVRNQSLTATGRVVGTPAYMAPEQYAGREADARSDQFSFCMSLWEALYRVRPFSPDDTHAIAQGRILPKTGHERVPDWLRAVILRGLAPDPAARWPSMRALLQACGRDPTRRRRISAAGLILLAGAGITFAISEVATTRAVTECRARAADLDAIFDDEVAGEIARAFASAGPTHGVQTAARVGTRLQTWRDEWSAARERTCTALVVDHAIDEETRARRDACLDDHAERLGMLVDILREADGTTVNNAVRATLELPAAAECEEPAVASEREPPDEETAREIRRELARSVLLDAAGRSVDAAQVAERARATATELGDPVLQAEADLRLGRALAGKGEYAEAETALDRAYFAAVQAGTDEVALDAATQLVLVVGLRLARYDDGLEWVRHARGLLARVGEGRDFRAASLEEQLANLQRARGDLKAALESHERALELWTAHAGPESPQVAEVLGNLASVLTDRGDFDGSERALVTAERLTAEAYGEDSLEIAAVHGIRCRNEFSREDFRAALRPCRRALELREGRLDPNHPSIATALSNLASVHASLDEIDAARSLLQRSVAIRRKRLGGSHPAIAAALSNLGVVEANAGDLEAAVKSHSEALEIRRRALPAGHPDVALSLLNLADVHVARAEGGRARPLVEEALAIATAGASSSLVTRARELLATLETPKSPPH